jgi:hypothetical protein
MSASLASAAARPAPGCLALGGDALAGSRLGLGLGLLEGGRLLLALAGLDLAGDVLGDRLIAGGAALARCGALAA